MKKNYMNTNSRLLKASNLLKAAAGALLLTAGSFAANAYTVSGTVFLAPNGLPLTTSGGSLNGTPMGTVGGLPLYIYVVDQARNIQLSTVVNPFNGTYSISGLVAGQAGAIQLASNLYPVGGKVTFVGLPSDYYAVGEGDIPSGDPVPDYSFPLAQSNDITVNFAFEARPGSTNYIISNYTYANGRLVVPAAAFNGSDPEDGTYGTNLAGRTVDFYPATPIATTKIYYYDTMLNFATSTSNITIEQFNPTRVSLAISGASSSRSFSYTVADNAGARPYVPATISTTIPLIVNLASFSGRWENEGAVINWGTVTEKTNDRFILERSTDGASFKTVAEIASKATKGSSDQPLSYTYNDNALAKTGTKDAYYRLRAIDNAGVATVSRILHLTATGTTGTRSGNSWSIFPNPANDVLNIAPETTLKGKATATLMSTTGAVLLSQELDGSSNTSSSFNVRNLPNGQYFLLITDSNGPVMNQAVTIAR